MPYFSVVLEAAALDDFLAGVGDEHQAAEARGFALGAADLVDDPRRGEQREAARQLLEALREQLPPALVDGILNCPEADEACCELTTI